MLHRRTWVKAPHTLRRQHSRTQKRHQATCAHVHHLLKIICRQSQLRYILRTHVPTIHSPTELSRSRIPSNAFRPHRLPHTNKQQRGTPSPQSHSQTVLYPPGQDIKNPQPHRCDTVPPQETTPTRKPGRKSQRRHTQRRTAHRHTKPFPGRNAAFTTTQTKKSQPHPLFVLTSWLSPPIIRPFPQGTQNSESSGY